MARLRRRVGLLNANPALAVPSGTARADAHTNDGLSRTMRACAAKMDRVSIMCYSTPSSPGRPEWRFCAGRDIVLIRASRYRSGVGRAHQFRGCRCAVRCAGLRGRAPPARAIKAPDDALATVGASGQQWPWALLLAVGSVGGANGRTDGEPGLPARPPRSATAAPPRRVEPC